MTCQRIQKESAQTKPYLLQNYRCTTLIIIIMIYLIFFMCVCMWSHLLFLSAPSSCVLLSLFSDWLQQALPNFPITRYLWTWNGANHPPQVTTPTFNLKNAPTWLYRGQYFIEFVLIIDYTVKWGISPASNYSHAHEHSIQKATTSTTDTNEIKPETLGDHGFFS